MERDAVGIRSTPVMPTMISACPYFFPVRDMAGKTYSGSGYVGAILAELHHFGTWYQTAKQRREFFFQRRRQREANASIKLLADSLINVAIAITKDIRKKATYKIDKIITIKVIDISSVAVGYE